MNQQVATPGPVIRDEILPPKEYLGVEVRKGQTLHWGFIAGGIVATCVSIALLNFPYRMLYFNKSFEAVTWKNNHCYATGERGDDVQLFCPELSPPRNRIVKRGEKDLNWLGVKESIFSRY